MIKRRRRILLAVILCVSVANYIRVSRNSEVRPLLFLTIFTIGAITALLINEFVPLFRAKRA